ncbi:DUF2306 domain-containing protein [Bernardetia sp. ABR2-2B]|uniref:DUF2306 domain-containing protein n=1 Tax=Bernardetia sp. ABR2-2B TaxID=3127472 RepID=UPI0030D53436
MYYLDFMFFHITTIIFVFFIGIILLVVKRGTKVYKIFGKVYIILMVIVTIITLSIPTVVEERLFNHFGWVHLFSLLVLYTVPITYLSIKKGNIKVHRRKMILLYFGALAVALVFTFSSVMFYETFFEEQWIHCS